jgi:hypothetical protein
MVPFLALTKATYPGDEDSERKTQAEVLLNAYSRELERRRLAAGAQGLLLSTGGTSFLPTSYHAKCLHA